MLAKIAYRGPDDRTVKRYRSPTGTFLSLGHARLSIIDTSPEANQPFDSGEAPSSLACNGQFYNFQSLRRELEATGAGFRTSSDTEVGLALLDRRGTAALSALWGMFAGAYWRSDTGKLVLFRDRFGKKPLHFIERNGDLIFASEPKAILAALDETPAPDDRALAEYFYLGYVPSHSCALQGMRKLPAGSYLEIGPDFSPRIERWYSEEDPPAAGVDFAKAFMDSVERRMVSDVPLAAFLSGGLDSSLVVAAMSRLSSKPVNTFSVVFKGPQALDESKYARLVAAHCNTNHVEVDLDTNKLRDALPQVLDHFDEPFGDSSAVPTWLVSDAARRQFTVVLTGDGADEVFGGYRKYLSELYLRKLGPYALRKYFWKPITSLLPTGRTGRLLETNRRIRRLLQSDARDAATRHVNLLHMSPISGAIALGPRLAAHGFDAVRELLISRLPADPGLNDFLKFDQRLVLQDDMFVKTDRMGMKASLELRSPFVDHHLVEIANRLPAGRKLQGTMRKRILVEELGHMLPVEILRRPKAGFEMPLGAWLRGDLRSWTENRLFEYADTGRWVDKTKLRSVWDSHRSGRLDCTELLWNHIVFASWLKSTYR